MHGAAVCSLLVARGHVEFWQPSKRRLHSLPGVSCYFRAQITMAAVATSIPAAGNSAKLAELSKQLSAEGELELEEEQSDQCLQQALNCATTCLLVTLCFKA